MSYTVYQTPQKVFNRVQKTPVDGLVVAKVPPAAIDALDQERDVRGIRVRFTYFAEQQRLSITIPTVAHRSVSRLLFVQLSQHIVQMSPGRGWRARRLAADAILCIPPVARVRKATKAAIRLLHGPARANGQRLS